MINNDTRFTNKLLAAAVAVATAPVANSRAEVQADGAMQSLIATAQQYQQQVQEQDQPEQTYSHAAKETQAHTRPADDGSGKGKETVDDTIVVTGTYIRGGAAAGANVKVFTSEDIDRSGYGTVQGFMSTVTQNFSGSGATEDPSPGPFQSSNQFKGASVDLRGLGPDSTLVLVNGRRTASSGLEGNFVDVSTIPQSAIERIEILTDGASALYGSDAVGGVVNFILRKDYEGAETRLRYGRTTEGNTDEYRLAQMLGQSWSGGNILLVYEYYKRDALRYKDRDYAATRDLRYRGGADHRSEFGNPGNILNPLTGQIGYAIPRNQNGSDLTVDDLLPGQANYLDVNPEESLLPEQKRHSGYLTAEHALSGTLTLFGEARFNERKFTSVAQPLTTIQSVPATNPFFVDPFGMGIVPVQVSLGPDLGPNVFTGHVRSGAASGGFTANFSNWRWQNYVNHGQEKSTAKLAELNQVELQAALADSNPETALNLFGHGKVNNPQTIQRILGEQKYVARSRITNVNTLLDGPLIPFRGRDISLAIGAEYRSERLRTKLTFPSFPPRADNLSRSIYAAFAEFYLPLFAQEDEIPLIAKLEASFAVRYDKYSDAGGDTNPKIGLRYAPFAGVNLSATYGTAFRAPNLTELTATNNQSALVSFTDPQSPSGRSRTLIVGGNDPDTTPENAKTWTVGLSIEPTTLAGFSASLHYASLKFKDRITSVAESQATLLAFSDRYPGIVIRNPDADLLQRLCTENHFPGDIATCVPNFIDVVIDQRSRNMAQMSVRSLDGLITYSLNVRRANLILSGSATYLLEHKVQQSPAVAALDQVGTYGNPVDFRSRASVSLSQDGIAGLIAMNYTDSYKNPTSLNRRKISSYTTFDLNIGVQFNSSLQPSAEGRHNLAFSVVNVFDNDPPFVDVFTGYDGANSDPLGRFISLELKIQW